MLKRPDRQLLTVLSLIAFSVLVYLVHYAVFHDLRSIFFYIFMDIGFLPIQAMLVSFVINRLLMEREKRAMLQKLNMVIGAFFTEMGTAVLKSFITFDARVDKVRPSLLAKSAWSDAEFGKAKHVVRDYECAIDSRAGDLAALQSLLLSKQGFLLRLLENPNLLEHETFTQLLWAVSHLTEELAYRPDLRGLPEADQAHLSGDIARAYVPLVSEWLAYTLHLRNNYPYLFSLVVRLNPFDPNASVVIGSQQ
jgi:hypothetical protein